MWFRDTCYKDVSCSFFYWKILPRWNSLWCCWHGCLPYPPRLTMAIWCECTPQRKRKQLCVPMREKKIVLLPLLSKPLSTPTLLAVSGLEFCAALKTSHVVMFLVAKEKFPENPSIPPEATIITWRVHWPHAQWVTWGAASYAWYPTPYRPYSWFQLAQPPSLSYEPKRAWDPSRHSWWLTCQTVDMCKP